MDEKEFFAANEAIETNPVVWLNKGAERTWLNILPADLPPDLRIALLDSRLTALHARGKKLIESGNAHLIAVAISDFGDELRVALYRDRQPGGRLHVVLPADELKRVAASGYLEKYLINGHEVAALIDGLELGEQIDITVPAFRAIKTNRREIARGSDFFDRLRPSGYSKTFWLSKCTSAARLAEAETMEKHVAAERERPQWNDSPESSVGPHARPR
jgi:hypothetical protein